MSTFAQQNLFNGACPVWKNGDLTTYGEGEWGTGGIGSVVSLLTNNYPTVYASASPPGAFVIGDTSKYTMAFSAATTLESYLPQSGAAGVLTGNLSDPITSSSGSFGGDVAALKVNVDFSDAGVLTGNAGLKFGDLTLCSISSPTGLNGTTVRQFLSTANAVLGAASTAFTAADLDSIAQQLDGSFDSGTPSTWAQQHLAKGTCP